MRTAVNRDYARVVPPLRSWPAVVRRYGHHRPWRRSAVSEISIRLSVSRWPIRCKEYPNKGSAKHQEITTATLRAVECVNAEARIAANCRRRNRDCRHRCPLLAAGLEEGLPLHLGPKRNLSSQFAVGGRRFAVAAILVRA